MSARESRCSSGCLSCLLTSGLAFQHQRQMFISIIVVITGAHVIRGFKSHNLLQKDKHRAWLSWVLMTLYASQVGLCVVRVLWSLQWVWFGCFLCTMSFAVFFWEDQWRRMNGFLVQIAHQSPAYMPSFKQKLVGVLSKCSELWILFVEYMYWQWIWIEVILHVNCCIWWHLPFQQWCS